MSQFLRLIQTGATAEIADAVEMDPALVEYRDAQGVSALLWAVYCGQPVIRDFFLSKLSAHNVALDVFEAAALGDEARLTRILEVEPGSAQELSGDGWTPLHLAAGFATAGAVAILLESGARVDALSTNPQQNQPLHAAFALGKDRATIEMLLQHGANPNATQVGGFTALFSAASANRRDLAELLLAHGAHAHLRNDQGKSAADYARERDYKELAAWLELQPS
ncbi:MAG TPA: ankyrin repeat domain-containing protein [Terracidiphilus sp.]|nr:ankyrin repeat domain-containing protein [Terracidiphilus sp.]